MIGRPNDRDAIMPGDPGYNALLFCRGLTIASLVLGAALLALPWAHLALLAAVALLPILAVAGAFASGGEITLGARAGTIDTRPTGAWALWLPALALALNAYFTNLNLLQPDYVLWAGGIGAVIFLMVILLADPIVRYSLPRAIPLAIPAYLYAAALAGPVDILTDGSTPLSSTTAQVIARSPASGHFAAYTIELSAWGPLPQVNTAYVTRDVYDHAAVGEFVCVSVHQGALAIKWFDVAVCQ